MLALIWLGCHQGHVTTYLAWVLSGARSLLPGLDADADYAAAGCIVSIRIQQLLRTAAGSEDAEKHAHKVHYFMLG
jgi:hypothetical protein